MQLLPIPDFCTRQEKITHLNSVCSLNQEFILGSMSKFAITFYGVSTINKTSF